MCFRMRPRNCITMVDRVLAAGESRFIALDRPDASAIMGAPDRFGVVLTVIIGDLG